MTRNMVIIGITGTLGAGKGTVVEHLVREKGFAHYSVREFLTNELERRGTPVTRDALSSLGDELRLHYSPSYIIEQLYRKAEETGQNAVIESIHNLGEVEFLRSKGALLFAVDADQRVRYERIKLRGSVTDAVSFEKFLADEGREMSATELHKQNIAACIALADYTIHNDATQDDLYVQMGQALKSVDVS